MPVTDPGWKRAFDDPIPLPRGRHLVNLEDAGRYIMRLPEAEQQLDVWQAVTEALILVVTHRGPVMFARIAMLRAFERAACREGFSPNHKDPTL
jgi:hypothetical protein